jgi:hypothetical protein
MIFWKTRVAKQELSNRQYLDETWRRTEILCGFAILVNLYIWAQYEGIERIKRECLLGSDTKICLRLTYCRQVVVLTRSKKPVRSHSNGGERMGMAKSGCEWLRMDGMAAKGRECM